MTQTLAPTLGTNETTVATGHHLVGSTPVLTTTVPRQFVHRAAVAEVFLTGWAPVDDKSFSVTAQWPRAHSFFTPISGHYDPMLAAETIRQVGALLAHTAFEVPLDHKFLMWDLNYTVAPEYIALGSTPADLELDVVCSEIRLRGRKLARLRYEAAIRHRGQVIATGGASYTCTSAEAYRRLRAAHLDATPGPVDLGAPVPPRSVGRALASDVVLSPGDRPDRWQLRVDIDHPILFDHHNDHVPGMVLLEAARQAAQTLEPGGSPTLPASMNSTFHRYAEFGTPCVLQAESLANSTDPADPVAGVRVTAHQGGELVFSSLVVNAPLPA
ncbi:ScbA/BarX family gamma-butyrolactone biosynthesis protein [Streptomyces sp. 21So2-11]|uniref:ScbA/BarX family gamma-butyrolactone biosynthesis protein n=1 Tax=Streptomyces sp. 21So2-11 TaxID=3144408 RepID=UPI00321BA8DC